jgi:hypothetical protein
MTPGRAAVIALTVAQSASMEYYERIVEDMFERTGQLVERLERKGTTPLRTRALHRFIGQAVGTRNEVLSVLHLLDKPDAAWDDHAMDLIYEDLRDEFDLGDRFSALELKLRGVQEALELVLDVSRDRRLVLLEAIRPWRKASTEATGQAMTSPLGLVQRAPRVGASPFSATGATISAFFLRLPPATLPLPSVGMATYP